MLNRNHLVVDPRAEEQARKAENPWTEAEKQIFIRKYAKHPKAFSKIAAALPNKTVRECISFYYYSQQVLVSCSSFFLVRMLPTDH